MLTGHLKTWAEDPQGGGMWPSIRKKIEEHDWDCTSLRHVWLPRMGGRTDLLELEDCHDCQLTLRLDGIWAYEKTLHDTVEELFLCKCCFMNRVQEDALYATAKDNIRSTRFFRWKPGTYDLPWWKPGLIGAEENCNRTVGIRTPWGLVFICLNLPLRQKSCPKCQAML